MMGMTEADQSRLFQVNFVGENTRTATQKKFWAEIILTGEIRSVFYGTSGTKENTFLFLLANKNF